MEKSVIFYLKLSLFVFASTFILHDADAQKTRKIPIAKTYEFSANEIYAIKLKDESSFTGTFIEKNGGILIFESQLGVIYEVNEKDITSIKKSDPINMVNGKYWFPNPHYSRYLFGPSAYNLKAGEGYYQNIYGVFNSVNYGFTDHFTLGAGTEIISLFSGSPVLALTPKFGGYQINDSWYGGGGAMMVVAEGGVGGIAYGIATYGNHNNNISFGLGWAFANFDDVGTLPIATISGMRRFSKNIAFISENWLIPANPYIPIFSYGIRFFGEQMSVDIALVNNYSIATEVLPIGLPFVDFVYKF